MKHYLIEITTYVDGSPEGKGIYVYDTETDAVANFHSKMGGAMKNANYATELLIVINENGGIVKDEQFIRESEEEPEPEE